MTRTCTLLLLVTLAATAACGAPAAASLDDDAVLEAPPNERLAELRDEVAQLEGQPALTRDPEALSRMRRWLDLMAEAPSDEAAIYEQAVRAQLEYLRTSELRRTAQGEGAP